MRRLRTIVLSPEIIQKLQTGEIYPVWSVEKLQPINERPHMWRFSHWNKELDNTGRIVAHFRSKENYIKNISCPYGRPGDRLHVAASELTVKIKRIDVEKYGSCLPFAWIVFTELLTDKTTHL